MQDASVLEKFRRRMEHAANSYSEKSSALRTNMAGPFENMKNFCQGMVDIASRALKQDCRVEINVMPYKLDTESFMVRYRFHRGEAQTNIDVTFLAGQVAYGGREYHVAQIAQAEDAIADAVLSFYTPRG